MRFPLRRVLLGFVAGATLGWVAGLVRRPADPPEGSGADSATRLPREEFGSPVEDGEPLAGAEEIAQEPTAPAAAYDTPPAPKKATARAVKRPPGTKKTKAAATAGASEPATAPEAGGEQIADDPAKPARRRRAAATLDPTEAAAAALREGHAAATERLADAEAEATPPPEDQGPARRRRRGPVE